ncbi:Tudor/PWWP/MBT superfamily protein [Rhynchospora pubera]|uniref:Tudor/PWWP/MBT superfamily protein n=1 Tax=Rhynchospora pubera TaxID=906938 RepID=A0AAV8F3D2_9POAL|nr:Tudor/PWWP/MBT superfamily protein [Rhynchospora pubera]
MASIPSHEPPIPEPHGLDHGSISPSETLAENPENPLDVEEEETNLEQNPENEIKTETETEPKTPKSRGRPKKKEKQKKPISDTRNKPKPETENGFDRPVYASPFQDETRDVLVPSDLVWGKVRSHPWWPGQIFDPSDASELALKHRNKNNFLVAYFGDNTFAWNEASVLKPFQSNFSRMVKQSGTDAFRSSVEIALAEVSWRVGSALCCGCYSGGESGAKVKTENAGIRADASSLFGDVLFIRSSFDPVKFVGFLCELGQNPYGGFENLDVVVAKAQLKAFNRSRGCNFDLPEFSFTCAFEEEGNNVVISDKIYTKKRKSTDSECYDKLVIGKYVPEEGRKKKKLSEIFNKNEILRTPTKGCKVRVGGPTGSDNSGKIKKKRLSLLGDFGTKLKARRKYLRVGQCMRRAANQTMPTAPSPKPNGTTYRKRKSLSMIIDRVDKKPIKKEKGKDKSDNSGRSKSSSKKKEVLREREDDEGSFSLEHYSSSSEMLSQLCLAARDPLKGYSFITMIDSFFSRFRNYAVNPSASKRNRRKSSSGKSSLVDDELWDSSILDIVVHDNDEETLSMLRQRKQRNRKREKEKNIEGKSAISDVNSGENLGNENKREGNVSISEKESSANVVSERHTDKDLGNENKQEGNVSSSEKESSVHVVSERHTDAEMTLSNAGSLDAFRPDVNFQLSCAPTSSNVELSTSQVEMQQEKDVAPPVKAAC